MKRFGSLCVGASKIGHRCQRKWNNPRQVREMRNEIVSCGDLKSADDKISP